jgi:putative hydrolase of the HAD superfamily
MGSRGLVIFDAFNTLVTSRPDSRDTFAAGLAQAGLQASPELLAELQAAAEGLDHSAWSGSRQAYADWAESVLRQLLQTGWPTGRELARCVVPALEQLHQGRMEAMPDALACLKQLKAAGFSTAVCSNWGWDLAADLAGTGLAGYIDVFVTSAQAGYRKPHTRIYQATLELAGFRAEDAVFIGDSLRTDALGPQRAGIRSLLVTRTEKQVHREQVASLGEAARLILREPAHCTALPHETG